VAHRHQLSMLLFRYVTLQSLATTDSWVSSCTFGGQGSQNGDRVFVASGRKRA